MSGFAGSDAATSRDPLTHFLGKPFRLPDLKSVLEHALEARSVT
ncbi:MAG TPA: hypothetical protein VM686_35970 [Polyangiaceae bacterium]|nr:hypothetical protein [Polyangiaceae bacterium]